MFIWILERRKLKVEAADAKDWQIRAIETGDKRVSLSSVLDEPTLEVDPDEALDQLKKISIDFGTTPSSQLNLLAATTV